MKHTYNKRACAWLIYADGNRVRVVVPDVVEENQKAYDGKTFPALSVTVNHVPGLGYIRRRVRLDGQSYDLHGAGTGEMIVRPA